MGNRHRTQAQFDRARWRVAILGPFWTLQIALLMALVGIFSYRLAETMEHFKDQEKKGKVPTIKVVWEAVNVGFSLASICLNTIEIAKLVRENLTPFIMVCSNIIKTTMAFGILGLDIVVYLNRVEGPYTIVGLAIDCGLLLCTIVPTVYAILVYRRLLKYDDYHHPANVKAYGFSTTPPPSIKTTTLTDETSTLELGYTATAYSDNNYNHNASSTTYPSQTAGRSRSKSSVSITSLSSLTSTLSPLKTKDRRISAGSLSSPVPGGVAPNGSSPVDPAQSPAQPYRHERSTAFDEYVSNRLSVRDGVEAAVAAEFGWGGGGSGPMSPHESGGGAVQRSDTIIIGSGTVSSARARPTAAEGAGRAVSWASSHGLVSVPEDEEGEWGAQGAVADDGGGYDARGSVGSRASSGSGSPSGAGAAAAAVEAEGRQRADSAASDREALLPDAGRMSDDSELLAGMAGEESRKRKWER